LAKVKVYQNINEIMTKTYFEIGKRIFEEEQRGKSRAEYGKELLKNLSIELTRWFEKGFLVANLKKRKGASKVKFTRQPCVQMAPLRWTSTKGRGRLESCPSLARASLCCDRQRRGILLGLRLGSFGQGVK